MIGLTKRTVLALGLTGALAGGLALPASTLPSWAQEADKIRIGMTVSSSGSFALASQSGERGVEIWVDEVNAAGGLEIDGQKRLVELVKRDDRSDKQLVARVYEDLIVNEKVDLLMAPFGSTLTAAAATVTERYGKFLMIWSAASDTVYNQGFKHIVSGTQIPVSMMPTNALALAENLGIKKVAIVSVEEPFPAGFAEAAKTQAEAAGMDVVMYEVYPKGTKDFSLLLQKAKVAGADLFFPTSYEGDLISMVRQMRQLDISFPMSFMIYASTPQFMEIGSDADFIYSHTNFHPDINWQVNAGLNRVDFLKAYQRLFPNVSYEPDFQTALAYGAGVITGKIIETAGSTDAAAMKQAALDLSGKLTILAGPYAINDKGMQLTMTLPIMQLRPGKGLVPVWPKDVATDTAVFPIPAWSAR